MTSPAAILALGPRAFWTIALTLFAVSYNVSVVPAIMPAIVRDFNSSMGFIQSILVLFSLVTAAFAPTAENLCRYFGRTRVFFCSLLVYAAGIACAASSPSIGLFAASFIILAGFGAASLVSTPWTIVDLAFGGKVDSRAIVALTVATTLGTSAGALLGGFLTSVVSWRWSFLPALALLVVVVVFSHELPKLTAHVDQPIDWIGGLLSLLGFGSILMGISLGGEFGWWTPRKELTVAGVVLPPFAISIVPTLIAAGAIVLGLLAFWQRRAARLHHASLLKTGLLRKRVFVCGTLAALSHTLVVTGLQFNLFQFLPIALGLDSFRTALIIVPYPTTVAVATVAARLLRLNERTAQRNVVFAGLAMVAAGIGILLSAVHDGLRAIELVPGLVVMGIGSGVFLSAVVELSYSAASTQERPECSAIYNPAQNLGTSLGRAILGTYLVFASSRGIVDGIAGTLGTALDPAQRRHLIFELQEMIQTLPRPEVVSHVLGRLPEGIGPAAYAIELHAAVFGMRVSLYLALAFVAASFLLARALPKTISPRAA